MKRGKFIIDTLRTHLPDTLASPPPTLNGPIIDLCDIADHYAAENRAKAKRLRNACYKGTQSPRADDLESAALIIEQLTKVLRTASDFKALYGDLETGDV